MLDLIEPFLHRDNLVFTRYDGSMRNDHREASLERLRHNSECRILLCSLKCGSLGLNLTAASRVVILEPFWNPFGMYILAIGKTCLGCERDSPIKNFSKNSCFGNALLTLMLA